MQKKMMFPTLYSIFSLRIRALTGKVNTISEKGQHEKDFGGWRF
jgi:hypothetical protein